jgi:phage tail sheath protein FI
MAAFTYPGVYIEELSSGQNTITGVATSIGAFVGWAPQGPVSEAVLVQSWSDYQAQFGGLDSRSWLGYAVNQFFANGGNQCYIVRVVWDGTIPGGNNNPVACATALAAGVGYGTATITATSGALSGSVTLGVGTPVLQSVSVVPQGVTVPTGTSPQLPPLPIGATLQLQATGSFSDGSTSTPAGVVWVPGNSSILSVSPSGLVTAGSTPGTATIQAVSGIITGSITLTVTAASISSISVSPTAVSTVVGQTVQLAAAANYSDGTSPNITAIANFSCATAGVVTFVSSLTVPPVQLGQGQFQALVANAGTTLSAAFPSAFTLPAPAPTAKTAALVVTAADIVSIAISPGNATVPIPADIELAEIELAAFTISSTLSNGTPGSTPAQTDVVWASSNMGVATVSGTATGANVTITGPGTTTITATYSPGAPAAPILASTTLTVLAAHLTGLNVTPATLTLASGLSQQLTVTGTFDDGSFVNMNGFATWTPPTGAPGAATVSASGQVTATKGITSNQSVTITASWLNISATAALTVTPPIPQSLAVTTTPLNTTSIAPGQNLSLVATTTNSDGTSTVVTGTAQWASSASSLISIAGPGVVAASASAGGSLTLFANSPGIWGNTLRVSISTLPAPNTNRFNLLLQQLGSSGQPSTLESYVNLSVLPTDPNYVVALINNDSNYITFINPAPGANGQIVTPTGTPAATAAVAFSGGADGTVLVPTDQNFELAVLSTSNPNAGINLLDRVDIFNLLCIPGETDAATISLLQAYCAVKRAFFIVDSPQYATISGLMASGPVGTPAGSGSITGSNASNSAFYFPWIQAPDPLVGNRPALFPPCGFVAGIYSATDASRGVWKAPAGINAAFTGNTGLQYVLTDAENGTLNPQAVNCLRQFKVYGDVVWGARTLAGNDQAGSQWKYVPIRRLALYLESSLFDGTQWVVFEPNDETLWGQIRLNIGTFMQGLFLQGAFAGTTPQQAYFVKCDAENNPPASIALGVVNILVGFAPLYPAEFVVIQIQQIMAQAS